MTIECSSCGEQVWCVRYDNDGGIREWICRDCYTENIGSDDEYWQLAREQKEERQRKREQQAFGEQDNW